MVHFLRRNSVEDDHESGDDKTCDTDNETETRDETSLTPSARLIYYPTIFFSSEQQQVLLDYMTEKLPKMETVTDSLHPLYDKFVSGVACTGMDIGAAVHPCTNIDISGMRQDIMSRLDDTCNDDSTFGSYSFEYRAAIEDSLSMNMSMNMSTTTNAGAATVVRFGRIDVREYNRIVGDHPDCSEDGPPLSIAWDYTEAPPMTVSQFEVQKRRRRKRRLERKFEKMKKQDANAEFPRVRNIGFTVPRIRGPIRRTLLHAEFDVPFRDMLAAEKEVRLIARQREESNSQSILAEKTQEFMEAAQRKLKKSVFFGPRPGGIERSNSSDEVFDRRLLIRRRNSGLSSSTASINSHGQPPLYPGTSSKHDILFDRRHGRRARLSTTKMQQRSGRISRSLPVN